MAFVALWIYLRKKKKSIALLGIPETIHKLSPELSHRKPYIKFSLYTITFCLLVLGLSRPQIGARVKEVKRKGIEIIVALDVSNSMMAQDYAPNRLEYAKRALSRLVEELSDDRIGLIVFAGDAYIQLPITSDFVSAKLFLNSIDPNLVPRQGTAIGKAITTSIRSFSLESKTGRALIIISDGENHDDNPLEATALAVKEGIKVYTIGIGSPSGSPIPTANGNLMKDNEGNIVVTKLDESTLQQIALEGNGKYLRATPTKIGLSDIVRDVRKLNGSELNSVVFEDFNEQYQYLFVIAFVILILEFLISNRKTKWLHKLNFFGRRTHIFLLLMLIPAITFAQKERGVMRKGNRAYRNKNYTEAEISYLKAKDLAPADKGITYNLGNALYKQNKFEQAKERYNEVISESKDPKVRSQASFNLGNTCMKDQKWEDAMNAFAQALRLNPNDRNAKENYTYAFLKNQQNKQDQKQQNKDNKDNKDEKNKDKNKDNKDNKNQQDKNKNNKGNNDNKQQNNKQNPGQQPKVSQQDAQRLLEAVQQSEKQTQDRVKKQKAQQAVRLSSDKNW